MSKGRVVNSPAGQERVDPARGAMKGFLTWLVLWSAGFIVFLLVPAIGADGEPRSPEQSTFLVIGCFAPSLAYVLLVAIRGR